MPSSDLLGHLNSHVHTHIQTRPHKIVLTKYTKSLEKNVQAFQIADGALMAVQVCQGKAVTEIV